MAFPPRDGYERFIYSLPAAHPEIQSSTLHLYANSPTTCFVRGSIWFRNGLELGVFCNGQGHFELNSSTTLSP